MTWKLAPEPGRKPPEDIYADTQPYDCLCAWRFNLQRWQWQLGWLNRACLIRLHRE